MSVDCLTAIDGCTVPPTSLGALVESGQDDDLHTNLENQGYLLIRNVIAPELVAVAKNFICQQLAAVDEIEFKDSQPVVTGRSRRSELHPEPGSFWRQISEATPLRQCVHSKPLYSVFSELFGETVRPFDFVWLRAFSPGRASPLHIDHPYMNRGTTRVLSCWIPLMNVSPTGGGLFIVEKSNQLQSLRDEFEDLDVDLDKERPGYIGVHALEFAQRYSRRLLTTRFRAGDVLIFDLFTAHASFDNNDPRGRVRLSCDTRWQPSMEPMDERFRGPNPPAHDRLGYACLSAAKPLTESADSR